MTINKNMTLKVKKAWKEMKENKTHPLPCYCAGCLYSKYRKNPRKKGRKFGMLTFFLHWIIYEIKKANLIENGKAEIIFKNGREYLKVNENDFEKTPYVNKTEKILQLLYEEEEGNDFFLDLEHLFIYFRIYQWRIKRPNFLNLIQKLSFQIWLDWIKTQPKPTKTWKKNWEDLIFAQKVANFICSQPKKHISQRTLLRHFSNKRKEDLIRIKDILRLNYNINFRKEGYRNKTIVYYYSMKEQKKIS